MKYLFFLILLCSGIAGFILSLHLNHSQESLNAIPTIETFHSPVSFVTSLKGDPKAGRKIFKEFCGCCHDRDPIINLNAPRIDEKQKWQALKKLGIPSLLKLTVQGNGAMPARGGCFECSDQQLKEAIHYMIGSLDKPQA